MGFDRSVSPSPSIRRSSIQSSEGDKNKENDHQVFVNMPKTPKKPNYMSPTISASSKVITPKKKILASEPILDNALKSLCSQELRYPQMPVSQFTLGKEDMDGVDRSVSSSSSSLSIRRSSLLSAVGESKENDHQTPKKLMISGSSKAITAKKKVLVERNEASELIPNDAHESLCPQEPRSPRTAVTRFTQSKEELDSSKPYDPLTNFLSPRPQFLRYNPNRRRETFGDGETEDGLIRRSSSSSSSSSISLTNGEICSPTVEEVKEEEVTDEEIREVEDKEEVTDEEVREVEVKEGEVREVEVQEEKVTEEEVKEAEEVEEIKVTNEEIEESDSSESGDEVKVGNFGSEVGAKTLLFLLILGLCSLLVIYVNCSTSSCSLRLRNGGIESDYQGARNLSLEAVLVKNNLQNGGGFWHQRVFERGYMVKEEGDSEDIIKWSEELKIFKSSVEETQGVDPTGSQIEEASLGSHPPTLSEDHYETEVSPTEKSIDTAETAMDELKIANDSVEEPEEEVEPAMTEIEEESLETDESIGSYCPTLSDDQFEAEVNLIEEAIETAETTIEEIVSESPVMIKARTLLANLIRTEAEFALKVFFGAVTLLTIVARYFLGPNSSPKTANKKNAAAAKEPQKPLMEEDHTIEDYTYENSRSSSIYSTEKGNEEYSKTKAPSVGFLTEFVVGEINSSPSYGRYSAQVKAPKKLASGEVSTVITPVRRSSRIRNRAVKSP